MILVPVILLLPFLDFCGKKGVLSKVEKSAGSAFWVCEIVGCVLMPLSKGLWLCGIGVLVVFVVVYFVFREVFLPGLDLNGFDFMTCGIKQPMCKGNYFEPFLLVFPHKRLEAIEHE